MRRASWMIAIMAAAFGFLAPAAQAQLAVTQFENFDDPTTGFELAGWTVDPPSTEGVQWATDSSPALIIAGGQASAFSSPNSLNFNDGVNYEDTTDITLLQTASSPFVDVTAIGPTLRAGWTMALNCEPDFDFLQVTLEDSVVGVLFTATFGSPGSTTTGFTLTTNNWTAFSLSGPTAGLTSVRLVFAFSCDGSVNSFPGAFVDNVFFTCPDAILPTAPALISPILGITVAVPFSLFWSPATDTTPCGPGEIRFYTLDIDDDPLFGSINFTVTTGDLSATVTALPPGPWNWRVRAFDHAFPANFATSAIETFFIEPEIAPDAPTILHVNTSINGAQSGQAGSVNPVIDETPVFSAFYTDLNTVAFAVIAHYQISTTAAFAVADIVYDSGPSFVISPTPKDSRCPDLPMLFGSLQRDTSYFWRVAFGDGSVTLPPDPVSGVTGPYSAPQSFRIGDSFEFGVRGGSSHHGRKCWVATAAFGSADASTVESLQSWRFGTMEKSAAGNLASRAYHVMGAEASVMTGRSRAVAAVLQPLGAMGGAGGLLAIVGFALLAILGVTRLFARA